MSPITTHVLDTALGRPAEAIAVTLYRVNASGDNTQVGSSQTDGDGRATDLMPEGAAAAGTYRIVFHTADYFSSSSRNAFYPQVEVMFEVTADGGHYHVPLLLSPFGYSTYRGS